MTGLCERDEERKKGCNFCLVVVSNAGFPQPPLKKKKKNPPNHQDCRQERKLGENGGSSGNEGYYGQGVLEQGECTSLDQNVAY